MYETIPVNEQTTEKLLPKPAFSAKIRANGRYLSFVLVTHHRSVNLKCTKEKYGLLLAHEKTGARFEAFFLPVPRIATRSDGTTLICIFLKFPFIIRAAREVS